MNRTDLGNCMRVTPCILASIHCFEKRTKQRMLHICKRVWIDMHMTDTCQATAGKVPCMGFDATNMQSVWFAGDENSVWDNLLESKMLIHEAVNTFSTYLSESDWLSEPPVKEFADKSLKLPLMRLMGPACRWTMAERAAGE